MLCCCSGCMMSGVVWAFTAHQLKLGAARETTCSASLLHLSVNEGGCSGCRASGAGRDNLCLLQDHVGPAPSLHLRASGHAVGLLRLQGVRPCAIVTCSQDHVEPGPCPHLCADPRSAWRHAAGLLRLQGVMSRRGQPLPMAEVMCSGITVPPEQGVLQVMAAV